MDLPHKVDLREHGVQLPTNGEWVNIPGSPFQVMTKGQDDFPAMWVRINPAVIPYWNALPHPMPEIGGGD